MMNFDPTEEDIPDTPWLRRAKFFAIIMVLAGAVGTYCAVGDFFQDAPDDPGTAEKARQRVRDEEGGTFRERFFWGAAVGGSFGLAYVLRCVVRKTDP